MKKIYFAVILIILGIVFRTIFHIAPNVEFVTAASFLAAFYIGRKASIFIPFIIMVLSDTVIGNTNIFLFTWSAYIFIGLFDSLILNKIGRKNIILTQTGIGVFTSLFFYLWTNFGVWFLDNFHMYQRTLGGLAQSYIMGIPFLKLNLSGNIFFIFVSFTIIETAKYFVSSRKHLFSISH